MSKEENNRDNKENEEIHTRPGVLSTSPFAACGQVPHHMRVPWNEAAGKGERPVSEESLKVRAELAGRIGLIMLSCGTGAWRVKEAMNTAADQMGLICEADVGLLSLEYTCFEKDDPERVFAEALSLPATGVNTDKLDAIERYVSEFADVHSHETAAETHEELDEIADMKGNYTHIQAGLASGFACMSFVFLLGGGIVEMLGALVGAFIGNIARLKLLSRKITLLACVAIGVGAACLTYLAVFTALRTWLGVNQGHAAGYIGSMLFVIPGFPLITSGLDIAKQDMRSGLERLAYALSIIITATSMGWLIAMLVRLEPGALITPLLDPFVKCLLLLLFSFIGVFGFSMMFNSPARMAATAGFCGMIANTLRLELVAYTGIPAAAAAFIGATTAGLLASAVNKLTGYPRITITVPSIVIMVPGLYMYTAIYKFGVGATTSGTDWLIRAAMIVLMLPVGLFTARVISDPKFRHGA
ncbi:MAG: threonine/serine exporter family protein [Eubacteriales bacterium]|nr:threonine/serine exporter family protein [Eubacteriales bacterium]